MRKVLASVVAMMAFLANSSMSFACGSCGCSLAGLGKDASVIQSTSKDSKIYVQYLFDQNKWDKMDAREAHTIHHQGHEFHDKTTEDFHHFKVGSYLTEDLNVSVDIPYVIRRSLEVEEHSLLGTKQKSEGWGDMQLMGDYRLWHKDQQSIKGVLGVQFPTGSTKELNTQGDRFEPELQPGSGAYNYIVGGIYQNKFSRSELIANATYALTTRGAQEFEAGDILTLSAEYDYVLNPRAKNFKTSLGLDTVYQYEGRDAVDGVKSEDSGGHLLLAGPVVKMYTMKNLSVFGSVLFPVYQQLGGVHQELSYEYTLTARVAF